MPDSYTTFKNKIGLVLNDDFQHTYINTKNDVVLAFPHKDCILEGGQTKDDQKRNEIFWNETLAPNSIDRLLSPKVLTNFKKYNKNGTHKITEIKGDENLIIKGNNLLAISSLLQTHRGKIKLIYIDPPYNTGNDSFNYNDSFNHSTWLTFMKNRLKIARELLKDDGVIFVHCDDNEQAYLKVLMDEIFGRDNFISNLVRIGKAGGGHDSQFLAVEYDYVLMCSKNINNFNTNKQVVDVKNDKKYKFEDNYIDKRGKYYLRDLDYRGSYSESLDYPIKLKSGKEIYAGGNFGKPNTWRWSKEKFDWGIKNGFIVVNEEKEKVYIKQYQFVDNNDNLRERRIPYRALTTSLNSQGAKEITQLFKNKVFDFPKPESFIQYILEVATKENDLVLDFHLGSGTTCAVAHKMGRKYIGIEQMDYIEYIAVERLKKVIEGEQGGISKSVNWQGGGEFVYAELMPYNQTYITKLQQAKTKEEVLNIWHEINEKATLNYQFDKSIFNENLDAFKTANIEVMKRYLFEVLDKNQLYVNYSEMNDKIFAVSEEDKKLNYQFYKDRR